MTGLDLNSFSFDISRKIFSANAVAFLFCKGHGHQLAITTVRWVSTVPYRNWYDTIVPFTKIACTLYDNVRPSSDRCSGPHLSLVQPHVEFISGDPTVRIYPMTPSLIALLEAVQKRPKN